jgi:hypothetical protein
MGFMGPNRQWMPMVGADMARVKDLKPIADQIAQAANKSYKILHFRLLGEIDKDSLI